MKKLEIVHNKRILEKLESIRKKGSIQGFTSMHVKQAYGPIEGEFFDGYLNETRYHTFIILEEEKFDEIVKEIQELGNEQNFIMFYSDIVTLK